MRNKAAIRILSLAAAIIAGAFIGGGGTAMYAQSRVVRGTVTDDAGEPLPGAAVAIQGTSNGTVTDVNGEFSLPVKEGQKLVFSFIGFTDKVVSVTGQDVYKVSLDPDQNILDDVVVVGYDTQKKVNLTGSVAAISSEAFVNRPIVQASTALQGLAPGVTVTTGGGAPGSDSGTIRIRGIGTFGGSSAAPLVLIDGVEGSLNDLDASLIDKISVLKDAASSSIYGSRAANGVILVTTKRAVKGKSSVTYRGYVGIQKPTSLPDLVDAEGYMTLSREAAQNDGQTSIYTDEYIRNYRMNNFLDPDAFPITDWQDLLLNGRGLTHSHNVSLNISSEKVRVMTSFGYLDQEGIIKRVDFKKYSFRNNMNADLTDKLHFRLDITGTWGHSFRMTGMSGVFNFMNARDPLMLAKWSDGSYAPFTGGSTNILPMVEQGLGGGTTSDTIRIGGAAALTYKPFKWLTLEGTAAPRMVLGNSHNFVDDVSYHSDPYGGISSITAYGYSRLTEARNRYVYGNWIFTATAHKKVAKNHDFKLLIGTSYETRDDNSLSAYRRDFAYPQYDVISAGGDNEFKDNSGTKGAWSLLSYFGRINYNFKERYLLEANIRFDGSSRFAKGNRWGIFPSFSGAWRITEEPFMASVKNTLTEMKIRASYGTLGNQNIGSDYYPTIQKLTISSISAADIIYPMVGLNTLANPDITWETSHMFDAGVDFSLWNKVSFTGDWYYKVTDGILMQLDIAKTIGLGAPYQNAGTVRNVGWETAIDYRDSAGDFNWSVSANLSDVLNKITDMKGTYDGSGAIRNQEGSSINSLYGLKCIGMARTQEEADNVNATTPQYNQETKPGDLIYEDYDQDGKIDDNDFQIIGSMIPRFTYGLTLNGGWKGLNLSLQFQGVGKADAYISSYYTQPCIQGGTFRAEHLDRWTPETPDGRFPRMTMSNDLNRKTSSFWMADASYLRLKNVQLSYNFPKKVTNFLHVAGLMAYVNATNLFTITNYYQGYDPETGYQSGTDGATTGAIGSNYPLVKTYTCGVEIKF